MNDAISPIRIESTEKFHEPEFSVLQRYVFAGLEQYSEASDPAVRAEFSERSAARNIRRCFA
jgi:hypothetical protein